MRAGSIAIAKNDTAALHAVDNTALPVALGGSCGRRFTLGGVQHVLNTHTPHGGHT